MTYSCLAAFVGGKLNRGTRWTEQQKTDLRWMRGCHVPLNLMARILGRSIGGIEQCLYHLGLKCYTQWNIYELGELMEYRELKWTAKQIAKKMNRTVKSIEGKVQTAGLTKPDDDAYFRRTSSSPANPLGPL